MSYTKNHIDAMIKETSSDFKWRFIGFYGHPETHKRCESWNLLAFLNSQHHLPWLCLSDFNEILSMDEKFGGAKHSQQQMASFMKVVNYCGFQDLGYNGPDFTWSNMQDGENRICLRLDRIFATPEWTTKFRDMKVHHLVDSTFDLYALLIMDPLTKRQPRQKRFQFEAMWTKRDDCRAIIEGLWGMGSDLSTSEGMVANLKNCASELSRWDSAVYGQLAKKIQTKNTALNTLTLQDNMGEKSLETNMLRREINDLLDDEEIYWGQRAKAYWLKEGGKNTEFFHA